MDELLFAAPFFLGFAVVFAIRQKYKVTPLQMFVCLLLWLLSFSMYRGWVAQEVKDFTYTSCEEELKAVHKDLEEQKQDYAQLYLKEQTCLEGNRKYKENLHHASSSSSSSSSTSSSGSKSDEKKGNDVDNVGAGAGAGSGMTASGAMWTVFDYFFTNKGKSGCAYRTAQDATRELENSKDFDELKKLTLKEKRPKRLSERERKRKDKLIRTLSTMYHPDRLQANGCHPDIGKEAMIKINNERIIDSN